jgi:hypothetical protein
MSGDVISRAPQLLSYARDESQFRDSTSGAIVMQRFHSQISPIVQYPIRTYTSSRSRILFGNAFRETLFRVIVKPNRIATESRAIRATHGLPAVLCGHRFAKQSFAAWVTEQSSVTRVKCGSRVQLSVNGLDALNAKQVQHRNVKQVQHRDVKPANLLLLNSGVKVADFELAKALEQTVGSNSGAGKAADNGDK